MIIDSHVNITENGNWFHTSYDASIERLLSEMKENAIDKCVLIATPFAVSNRYIAEIVNKYPDLFRGMAWVDFNSNIKNQIDEIIAMGFKGIKIHPRIQNINIADLKYADFWDYINQKELILQVCGFLQISNDSLNMNDLQPTAYESFIKTYKRVKFILSHGGCHKLFDTYFLSRANSNFFSNISFLMNRFEGTTIIKDLEFVLKNADKKFLFGSDFPEVSLKEAKAKFDELTISFPNEKRENLLFNNAFALYWK